MITTKALLAQVTPAPGNIGANLETAVDLVESHPDVDLVVLPELFLQGYTLAGVEDLAVPVEDDVLEPLRRAAARRGTGVILGLAERVAGRPPADSVLCLDERGETAGVYRKVHLFGAEAEHFSRGGRYLVVSMCRLHVGPLICYDVEFPEPARALALGGAEILVTVSANMAPYQREHDLFSRARAVENRRPHIYVNRVGSESGLVFVGGSRVIDATGDELLTLGQAEAVGIAELRSREVPQPDYLADLRPGVPAVPAVARPIGPDDSFQAERPMTRARSGGIP